MELYTKKWYISRCINYTLKRWCLPIQASLMQAGWAFWNIHLSSPTAWHRIWSMGAPNCWQRMSEWIQLLSSNLSRVPVSNTFIVNLSHVMNLLGSFHGGSVVKNPPAMQETWVWSLGWEDPLAEGMETGLHYSCLENPHGQRSLEGCSPWGRKESDTTQWLNWLTDLRKYFNVICMAQKYTNMI